MLLHTVDTQPYTQAHAHMEKREISKSKNYLRNSKSRVLNDISVDEALVTQKFLSLEPRKKLTDLVATY